MVFHASHALVLLSSRNKVQFCSDVCETFAQTIFPPTILVDTFPTEYLEHARCSRGGLLWPLVRSVTYLGAEGITLSTRRQGPSWFLPPRHHLQVGVRTCQEQGGAVRGWKLVSCQDFKDSEGSEDKDEAKRTSC